MRYCETHPTKTLPGLISPRTSLFVLATWHTTRCERGKELSGCPLIRELSALPIVDTTSSLQCSDPLYCHRPAENTQLSRRKPMHVVVWHCDHAHVEPTPTSTLESIRCCRPTPPRATSHRSLPGPRGPAYPAVRQPPSGSSLRLLEEEKQAVVNRAVTRGLDPNIDSPRKNSVFE